MPEDTDRPAERPPDHHPADATETEAPDPAASRAARPDDAPAPAVGSPRAGGTGAGVVVRPAVQPVLAWRGRAASVAARAAEVARRPAVAGAAATVAGVAARVAVELLARRLTGTPPPAAPAPLDVTGRVIHHVHVVHHVHVLHHSSDPLILPALPVIRR